ncbi:hypothetical protein ND816_01150 [Leptospira levettii]|uniref:hypothetical protein n=1 Tax=Leptospira levettii TaxID=2023178 RepID=UPI00223DE3B7|nr:hypothetical protein [Leptospira levettii]MCW7506415.1 hypothetical protein [Leptospira levettii]MCW7517505.1 hypothetical protein [Leptospira levettii]
MNQKLFFSLFLTITYLSCKNSKTIDPKTFLGVEEIKTISLSEFKSNLKPPESVENVETSIANLGSFSTSIAIAKSKTIFKANTNSNLVPRAIFILSGSGKIHFDDIHLPVKENDWIHFPPANAVDLEPTPGKVIKLLIFHGYIDKKEF